MPPRVSVNLCCYNSERFLVQTLRSICAQSYQDWELVVVDDGSQDRTSEIVQASVAEGWPIRYHRQENAGLGRARQRALDLSRGEFIALIDHDDEWLPTKLARQVELLDAHPSVGLVYADAEIIDAAGSVLGRYFDDGTPRRGLAFAEIVRTQVPICLPTVVVRRQVCQAVGGFRPFAYAEDYDLLIRVAERYPIEFDTMPVARYRVHGGNYSRRFDTLYRERNTILEDRLRALPADARRQRRVLSDEIALNRAMYAAWSRANAAGSGSLSEVAACLRLAPRRPKPYLYCLLALLPAPAARLGARLQVFRWVRKARGRVRRAIRGAG